MEEIQEGIVSYDAQLIDEAEIMMRNLVLYI